MICGETRLVALLGHPVAHSLSPRMQNAAFAARGLDWAYVALDVAPERLEDAVRGLAALGFAGANVTAPHKLAAARLCDEARRATSVNTLVFRDGRIVGTSTDAAVLDGLDVERPASSARRRGARVRGGAARARASSRGAATGRPTPRDADLVVQRDPGRATTCSSSCARARRSSTCRTRATRDRARRGRAAAGARWSTASRRSSARARRPSSSGPASRAGRRDAARRTLAPMTLELATAGESHGPALVAILERPAGRARALREAIDADLRRRQQGYGRTPRQQIETDEVEVLAGLRHGRTLGTPLALVVRNRDHENWTWGMSPWPPEGEPAGQGHEAGDAPAARPRRPRGRR